MKVTFYIGFHDADENNGTAKHQIEIIEKSEMDGKHASKLIRILKGMLLYLITLNKKHE